MKRLLLAAAALLALSCTQAPLPEPSALASLGFDGLPLRAVDRPPTAEKRLEPKLRFEMFPRRRKDEPLRLCVDFTRQADLSALGAALDEAGLNRDERARRLQRALDEGRATRTEFRAWLDSQEGAGGLREFVGIGRVCFDGSERIGLAAAEREDVAWVMHSPEPVTFPPETLMVEREAAQADDHWALEALGVSRVHAAGHRGEGVVVAVLDSGVDDAHPALAGRSVGNLRLREPRGQDLSHGRQVLAAAVGAQGLGVAPAASWAAADPLPDDVREPELFAECIDWLLAEVRPQVVVAPWDMPPGVDWTTDLQVGFGALRTAGAAVVFPAGNTGPAAGQNRPPGNLTGLAPDGAPAFSVAGLDRDDSAYRLSNRGPNAVDGSPFPQVAAPAVRLAVLDPSGRHDAVVGEGTSFSSGLAAGVLALLMEARPELTGPEAEALLRRSARDLGPEGHDPVFGHGALDLAAALGLP